MYCLCILYNIQFTVVFKWLRFYFYTFFTVIKIFAGLPKRWYVTFTAIKNIFNDSVKIPSKVSIFISRPFKWVEFLNLKIFLMRQNSSLKVLLYNNRLAWNIVMESQNKMVIYFIYKFWFLLKVSSSKNMLLKWSYWRLL